MNMSRKARLFSLWTMLAAVIMLRLPAIAAPPSLSQVTGNELPGVYQAGRPYTLSLIFTDADGDRPRKASFVDESPAGTQTIEGRIGSGDPRAGVTIEWPVRGFAGGGHRAYFEVRDSAGQVARYPATAGEPYSFVAENVLTKWIILGAGLLVGLMFVPFLAYVLTRSLNRSADPSRAARTSLLLGILACCALFIYLFASVYGPLAYIIGGLAALALLIVVLTRR